MCPLQSEPRLYAADINQSIDTQVKGHAQRDELENEVGFCQKSEGVMSLLRSIKVSPRVPIPILLRCRLLLVCPSYLDPSFYPSHAKVSFFANLVLGSLPRSHAPATSSSALDPPGFPHPGKPSSAASVALPSVQEEDEDCP